ncbi:MAG: hypothetical protein ACJARD_001604 [Alphaproteobacteria bacterium]|jgi:hypothetical protein
MQPRSLISKAKIELSKILQKTNQNEFHHIFPKAYLKKINTVDKKINVLANICFLTRKDNGIIKAKPPSEYCKLIEDKSTLDNALIPQNFDQLTYVDFLNKRVEMLEKEAHRLM